MRLVFLHNDDRIHALVAVVGIALVIYGLIEADLRAALGSDTPLPGLLPEHRDAVPTARAVLAAFTDLHATYTTSGLVLDRLTPVQRLILAHLDIFHGLKHKASQQHSRTQDLTTDYAENGASADSTRRARNPS